MNIKEEHKQKSTSGKASVASTCYKKGPKSDKNGSQDSQIKQFTSPQQHSIGTRGSEKNSKYRTRS